MTMRTRQLLVMLGIVVLVVVAIVASARPSGGPVPSAGPSPTGGIGQPASTVLPTAGDRSPSPAGSIAP